MSVLEQANQRVKQLSDEERLQLLEPANEYGLNHLLERLNVQLPHADLPSQLLELYSVCGGEKENGKSRLLGIYCLRTPSAAASMYGEYVDLLQQFQDGSEGGYPLCWYDVRLIPFAYDGGTSLCINVLNGMLVTFNADDANVTTTSFNLEDWLGVVLAGRDPEMTQ